MNDLLLYNCKFKGNKDTILRKYDSSVTGSLIQRYRGHLRGLLEQPRWQGWSLSLWWNRLCLGPQEMKRHKGTDKSTTASRPATAWRTTATGTTRTGAGAAAATSTATASSALPATAASVDVFQPQLLRLLLKLLNVRQLFFDNILLIQGALKWMKKLKFRHTLKLILSTDKYSGDLNTRH